MGDRQADDFAVHLGSDPKLGFLQGFSDGIHGGGVPGLDHEESGLGGGDARELFQAHGRAVSFDAQIFDERGRGLTRANSLKILLHFAEGFFHFLLGFEKNVVGRHRLRSKEKFGLALGAFARAILFFSLFKGSFHATQEVGRFGGVIENALLLFEGFVGVGGGFDGEADAALRLVQADDTGFDLLAGLEDIFHLGDALFRNLGDVHQAIQFALELDKGAKAGDLADGAFDHLADFEAVLDLFPRIFGELLQAEGDSLVGFVDSEDLGFHRIALLEHFGCVGGFPGPRHIGNVNHAVDALFQLDKCAIGGGVAHGAFDGATHRVAEMDFFPRIGLEMADGEGEFLLLLADADDNGIDLLPFLKNIAGAIDPARPGKFGDVDEAFDARLQLHEGSIGDQAGNFPVDLEIDRIFFGNLVPRIFRHLFHPERNTEAFFIDFENEDLDFLAGLQHFGGVAEASPGHIGHVEKAVETIQIDEGPELGQIFDAAFDLGALIEVGEELGAFLVALFFDEFATGKNHIFAILIQFDDAAFQSLVEEFAEVFRGIDIDLRGGQEGLDADIHHQAALDDSFDDALNRFAGLAELDDLVPVLFVRGFLAGEDDLAVLIFQAFEEDFNLLTDGEIVRGAKFIQIDRAFRFVADIDHDFAGAAFDDATFDDGAFLKVLHRLG